MTRRQIIGLAPFAAFFALKAAVPHMPFEWGHRLGDGCYWVPRASWAAVGPSEPDTAAARAEWACLQARGAKAPGPIPKLNQIVRKFPSEAQMAPWRSDDANGGALHSGE